MKLTRAERYWVDFSGKAAQRCPFFLGLGFFLLALYYFAARDLTACGVMELLLCLILPLTAAGIWMLLARILPLRDARIYGVAAAILLLSIGMQGMFTDTFFPEFLLLLWYIALIAVVLAVTFGFFPYPLLARICVAVSALLRLTVTVLRTHGTGHYAQCLPHFAAAAFLLAIAALLQMFRAAEK